MTVDARNPTGQPLDSAERSRLIAESLRQMARVSRHNDPRAVVRGGGLLRGRDLVTPLLFLALCVLPSLLATAFFGFYLSDRYVTEVHFAIRPALGAAENAARDGMGMTAAIPREMIAQDTLLLADYIASRPMVEAIERQLPLREMFSRPSIDALSRFDPKRPVEKLVRYWRNRVAAKIEGTSGIISVTVNAFEAGEAVAISRAVLAESERMVNDLNARARQDALAASESALARIKERLDAAEEAVRDLRNRDRVLDALKTNEATIKTIGQLREQRIALSVKQSLLLRDLREDARSVQDLKAQIAQLDGSIQRLEREATTPDPTRRQALADALTRFEEADTERKNAQALYNAVLAARDRARMILDRQFEFFSVVVAPVEAQSPQQPRRGLWIGSIVAASALAFAAVVMTRKILA
ncbi:capsule polysaccharide export protein-like protein [Methylobacterium sp. 4-46]|uniref:capsule polysaccharide transporter n=1 Tax=unclassified Methylobacterium TaxID=2615210 RepID=UPI000152BFBF|nr:MULTISPECIES: capsule polysaccharide transporter [Methylobacterium]ACA15002.1 capsule polysaccharide export protein-like protein [Methylobacterium sp. 4-46]WFT80740.1 capsule biosynthesis protein [Methylobacterium nodulans]